MSNGEVVFVNYSNLHTFSVALSEKAKRASNEESKTSNVNNTTESNDDMEEVSVLEISWDPNEDNLIVSLDDGSMFMITFQGMTTEQCFIAT